MFSRISCRMNSESGEHRVTPLDTESNFTESQSKTPKTGLDQVGLTDPTSQKNLNEDPILPPTKI